MSAMHRLPLFFARRYLFSKKSHSVINLVSIVSAFSVAIPVAAMVILLVGLFKGPYRKQYLALRAAEKQQKALGTAEE